MFSVFKLMTSVRTCNREVYRNNSNCIGTNIESPILARTVFTTDNNKCRGNRSVPSQLLVVSYQSIKVARIVTPSFESKRSEYPYKCLMHQVG